MRPPDRTFSVNWYMAGRRCFAMKLMISRMCRWMRGSPVVINAFGCRCIMAAITASKTSLVRIGREISCRPSAGTAMISSSRKARFESLSGFHMNATRASPGTYSFKISSRFPIRSGARRVSGDVSLRSGEVGHETRPHRIANTDHDDGDRGRRLTGRPRRRRAEGDEDVHRQRGKLERGPPKAIDVALRGAIFKGDVLAHHIAIIAQALPEVIPYRCIIHDADARNPATRLLRARRERPRRRAADERDELAPAAHSITSSARASTDGGTSRPSAFAVLRLMSSSNFVGCSTGRSPGF